ncbi:hypothetical protein B0H14DRAFT_2644376 [Mycena olivaceomarginata]|nr:hypothetical protein B0H14DRAFT_2644376 [Mycena olivaceomarginata]
MSYQCFSAAGARSLKSSFTLNAPAINATAMTLFLADQTANCTTGIQTFAWSSENAVPAMLQDEHMSRWKSKVVFKIAVKFKFKRVTYKGLAYVAKRCYTVGRRTPVSILVNRDELVKEGTTLGCGKYFLDKFKEECQEEEIDISGELIFLRGAATPDFVKDFEVIDFILARGGIIGSEEGSEKPTFIPSPASGIDKMEYIELLDEGKDEIVMNNIVISSITWLLEPERGNAHFRKFSGTLEHPRSSDKQGATINLFQHFAYIQSNKTLVLADIHSSESHNTSSKSSILFDLMSHTITRVCP